MKTIKVYLQIDRITYLWIQGYCDARRLTFRDLTERQWRKLRMIIGDDYLPAPKPYDYDVSDVIETRIDAQDEETLQWLENYCKHHAISKSEVTERLFKKLRESIGDSLYSHHQIAVGEAIEHRLRKSRRS